MCDLGPGSPLPPYNLRGWGRGVAVACTLPTCPRHPETVADLLSATQAMEVHADGYILAPAGHDDKGDAVGPGGPASRGGILNCEGKGSMVARGAGGQALSRACAAVDCGPPHTQLHA